MAGGRVGDASRSALQTFRATWREDRATRPFPGTTVFTSLYVVLWVLITAGSLLQDVTAGELPVSLPVQSFWPQLPAGSSVTGGPANVVGGGFTAAAVTVSGLGWDVRSWLIAAHLLIGLTNVTVGMSLLAVIVRLKDGAPFAPSLRRLFVRCAVILIACGIAWQLCQGIANTIAARVTLGSWGASSPTSVPFNEPPGTILGIPSPGFDVHIDFWPIGIGIVLLVLARLVSIGERLQRDTEGLV